MRFFMLIALLVATGSVYADAPANEHTPGQKAHLDNLPPPVIPDVDEVYPLAAQVPRYVEHSTTIISWRSELRPPVSTDFGRAELIFKEGGGSVVIERTEQAHEDALADLDTEEIDDDLISGVMREIPPDSEIVVDIVDAESYADIGALFATVLEQLEARIVHEAQPPANEVDAILKAGSHGAVYTERRGFDEKRRNRVGVRYIRTTPAGAYEYHEVAVMVHPEQPEYLLVTHLRTAGLEPEVRPNGAMRIRAARPRVVQDALRLLRSMRLCADDNCGSIAQ